MDNRDIDQIYNNVDIGFSLGAAEIYLADYIMGTRKAEHCSGNSSIEYSLNDNSINIAPHSLSSVREQAVEEIKLAREGNENNVPDLSNNPLIIDRVIENAGEIVFGHMNAQRKTMRLEEPQTYKNPELSSL